MLKKILITTILLSATYCYASKPQNVDEFDAMLQSIEQEASTPSGSQVDAMKLKDEGPKELKLAKENAVVGTAAANTETAVATPAPAPAIAPEPEKVVATPAKTKAPVAVTEPVPMPAPEPAPVMMPTPTPVPTATAPIKAKKVKTAKEDDKIEVYHFGYIPDDTNDDHNYSAGTQAGHPGNFLISFYGEFVDYKASNKGKAGFEGEVAWQMNLMKYMSLVASFGAGYRKGNLTGKNLTPITLKGAVRFRALPWLFPFVEGGVEFTKVSTNSGWEKMSKVFGGGLAIRIGAADKKSEYNMYRLTGITRTMLILGFDYIKTPYNTETFPDAYLLKGGLSFEF